MEENAECIDSLIFDDEREKNSDFSYDEEIKDERLRLTVIDKSREIKFDQEKSPKKLLKKTDEEKKFIFSDKYSYEELINGYKQSIIQDNEGSLRMERVAEDFFS